MSHSFPTRRSSYLMYALMGVGLSLIFGILGIVNFAHGELFMIGTYVMVLVSVVLGLPFIAGIAAAGVVLFIVGALVERGLIRSEEQTSELQSLMRISYAGFCLTKKKT